MALAPGTYYAAIKYSGDIFIYCLFEKPAQLHIYFYIIWYGTFLFSQVYFLFSFQFLLNLGVHIPGSPFKISVQGNELGGTGEPETSLIKVIFCA